MKRGCIEGCLRVKDDILTEEVIAMEEHKEKPDQAEVKVTEDELITAKAEEEIVHERPVDKNISDIREKSKAPKHTFEDIFGEVTEIKGSKRSPVQATASEMENIFHTPKIQEIIVQKELEKEKLPGRKRQREQASKCVAVVGKIREAKRCETNEKRGEEKRTETDRDLGAFLGARVKVEEQLPLRLIIRKK